ncbi:hypothetical protein HPS36_00095 [Halorubrum salinarum]|uniref:Uncharacterized protein n=1 Tax=Halorubrum salinarum TaxID=2739057 RepID=A0A7D3XX10_9EURY|nr:hypothetical protein [Halorubrum salinarum]QKG91314.1 hypothetical protein HPS36_00095 [Halorubrum salinarum]
MGDGSGAAGISLVFRWTAAAAADRGTDSRGRSQFRKPIRLGGDCYGV